MCPRCPLGADRDGGHQAGYKAGRELALAQSLAERAAPLLDRSDLMRLSVLTAVGRDQAPGRVILLDRAADVFLARRADCATVGARELARRNPIRPR